MKPEDINRAMAELCRWKYGPIDIGDGLDVDHQSHVWWRDGKATLDRPPNYLASLDAAHEARRHLVTAQETKVKFLNTLRAVVGRRCSVNKVGVPIVTDYDLIDATAAEICETLLRLHNKWPT